MLRGAALHGVCNAQRNAKRNAKRPRFAIIKSFALSKCIRHTFSDRVTVSNHVSFVHASNGHGWLDAYQLRHA